jgi:hypothetical protein
MAVERAASTSDKLMHCASSIAAMRKPSDLAPLGMITTRAAMLHQRSFFI